MRVVIVGELVRVVWVGGREGEGVCVGWEGGI